MYSQPGRSFRAIRGGDVFTSRDRSISPHVASRHRSVSPHHGRSPVHVPRPVPFVASPMHFAHTGFVPSPVPSPRQDFYLGNVPGCRWRAACAALPCARALPPFCTFTPGASRVTGCPTKTCRLHCEPCRIAAVLIWLQQLLP